MSLGLPIFLLLSLFSSLFDSHFTLILSLRFVPFPFCTLLTADLSEELEITPEAALSIIKCIQNSLPETSEDTAQVTAKDVLLKSAQFKPTITFCKAIDTILGGGIPIGQITGGEEVSCVYCLLTGYDRNKNKYAVSLFSRILWRSRHWKNTDGYATGLERTNSD